MQSFPLEFSRKVSHHFFVLVVASLHYVQESFDDPLSGASVIAKISYNSMKPEGVNFRLVDKEKNEQAGHRLVIEKLSTSQSQTGTLMCYARLASGIPRVPLSSLRHRVDRVPSSASSACFKIFFCYCSRLIIRRQ